MSYWDTSALLKLYVPEPDSPEFVEYVRNHPGAVTAHLAAWEALTAFRRKEAEGIIKPGAAKTLHEALLQDGLLGCWRWVELSPAVEAAFGQVLDHCFQLNPPLVVRTLDAIHLACARAAGETEIVATDRRLRAVAQGLGYTLFPR
jgi:predicted nucleic acid-binding protein